jgi:hypothetical protein
MDASNSFERLIRMVQETGERMVVSLDPLKEPVVLLPLSLYEQLVADGQHPKPVSASRTPVSRFEEVLPSQPVSSPSTFRASSVPEQRPPSVSDAPDSRSFHVPSQISSQVVPSRTPFVPPEDMVLDPVDAWDGEGGEEYDAERIFAAAALGAGTGVGTGNGLKPFRIESDVQLREMGRPMRESSVSTLTNAPHGEFPASDRLKASVSRASEAYEAMHPEGWREGSGGQRLPIRPSSLQDEERFSLGMG